MAGWQTTEKSAYMKSKDCPSGQSFLVYEKLVRRWNMKNYDAKQALSVIISCAKAYNKKLNNKHFLIVYQDKNII